MNKVVKEKWLHALRSGEYKQGYGFLRQNNKYCCLGVLCDLHAKEHDEHWIDCSINNGTYSYFDNVGFLPIVVAKWARLEKNIFRVQQGAIAPNIYGVTLNQLNDGDLSSDILKTGHLNFDEIADLIQEHL